MGVVAQLSVRRGRDAVAFYVAVFGAEVVYQVGGTDDAPAIVAQLVRDDTSFWVSDEAPEMGNYSPESLGGTTAKLLLVTDDPHDVHARAVAAGARDAGAVKSAHGWLIGRIIDPFGHCWEIGKPIGPWPPVRA